MHIYIHSFVLLCFWFRLVKLLGIGYSLVNWSCQNNFPEKEPEQRKDRTKMGNYLWKRNNILGSIYSLFVKFQIGDCG